ncbi:MAG: hypothetical protein AAGA77_16315 [Bacteroidota bacterium]
MQKKDISNYLNRLIVFLCLLCFGGTADLSAQFTVYGIAKKGNIKKHGKVITYEPMRNVVMNCQGDTLSFDLSEYTFRFTTKRPPKPYVFPDGKKYHRVALGILPGQPGDGGYINYTYHYQRTQRIGYGGGLAFENYGDADGYDFLVPNVVFYSYLRKKNSSPFIRLSAGYGIAIKNTAKFQEVAEGGINLGAAVGMRLSTNRVMIDFALGMKYQKGYYEFEQIDLTRIVDANFQRLDFSVGFMW